MAGSAWEGGVKEKWPGNLEYSLTSHSGGIPMYCPFCGTKRIKEAQFCGRCGRDLAATETGTAPSGGGRLPTGTLLDGRYEILSHIGTGGFGRVYKACDNRFAAEVAIKEMVLEADTEEERNTLQRYFQQEARLLFNLKHASLPKVIDYFFEDEAFFLVMEYIEGESLREIMRSCGAGAFSEEMAIQWFFSLLDILEHLHNQAPPIIHRDVKPDNLIWKNKESVLYLVDFGIARAGIATRTSSYGTPGYAAPEQASGQAHPSVDIYSAGATLHHLLSGVDPADHPFDFESLSILRPDINPHFAETIDRMVALRSRDRFQNIQDVRLYYGLRQEGRASEGTDPGPTAAAPSRDFADEQGSLTAVYGEMTAGRSFHEAEESAAVAPDEAQPSSPDVPGNGPIDEEVSERGPEGLEIPEQGILEVEIPIQTRPERPGTPLSPAALPEGLSYLGQNSCGYEEYENERDAAYLIWIPEGEFSMGSGTDDRDAKNDERPLHAVTMQGYWIYAYEVTNRQFALFISSTGYGAQPEWEDYLDKTGEQFPVAQISWDDARAYCRWAGGDLPTEAQWEKAARGPDDRIFPWGSFFDASRLNCWDSSRAPWKAHFFEEKGPSKIGMYDGGASPYGLMDMAGNVWEWCRDGYDEHYYRKSPDREPWNDNEKSPFKVARGGSWNELPGNCRISRRLKCHGQNAARDRGFRCVREMRKKPDSSRFPT
jgi:eukaryotic-like serine/threonine-protein kinase